MLVAGDHHHSVKGESPLAGMARQELARLEGDPALRASAWLAPLRSAALERFMELGLPTTHDEEWRFTSVASLERTSFVPSRSGGPRPPPTAAGAALQRGQLGLEGSPRLAFVNGRLSTALSTPGGGGRLPGGVRLVSLAAALATERALVEAHLGHHAGFDTRPFTALNTALFEDGAFLRIEDGVVLTEPIVLLFLSVANGEPPVGHPRILVIAGKGSQATIVEAYAGAGRDVYFTNAVTELATEAGAVLDHYKLQWEAPGAFHIANFSAHLASSSVITSHSISFGGGLVRNDVTAILDGEGAECTLDGLFIGTGSQHVDNHVAIDHARPHGTSRQTYKGILDGSSRGVFDGKIVVRKDAQKTDARQTNKNLLLSDAALINTKPQLEILADDVKCAHAATIGRLDDASLFYLRSRGLGLGEARSLLIHAFGSEILDRVKIDVLRARLDEALTGLLRAGGPEQGEEA